jgi:D-alanyl-D-alanine dipeptidase
MMRRLTLSAILAFAATTSLAQERIAPGFVYLRDVDASIAQDIRYASEDNFTGQRLPGYDAPECILRSDAANALKRVQADLASQGLSLKTYDCYRPARASRAMLAWANDRKPDGPNKRFYPALEKRGLFSLGYISTRSLHQTGTAIDLTLIPKSNPAVPPFNPLAAYGSCIGPEQQRAPDNSIDMGTGYDCFDVRSHTRNNAVSAEAQRSRRLLVDAMAKHGFRNYHREWWHFEFVSSVSPFYYDFPIRPR